MVKLLARELGDSCLVCAMTGVAACNVGGVTWHKAMGLMPQTPLTLAVAAERARHFSSSVTRVIVDECSMMTAEMYDFMDALLQAKHAEGELMGGIPVLFTGDFCQLGPVYGGMSQSMRRVVPDECVVQSDRNYRAKDDPEFSRFLDQARVGGPISALPPGIRPYPDDVVEFLLKWDNVVHLSYTKDEAEKLNEKCLARLPGKLTTLNARRQPGANVLAEDALIRGAASHFNCPSPLKLKLGCKMMLVVNLDVAVGLVNGAVGVFRGMESRDVLLFEHRGVVRPTSRHVFRWKRKDVTNPKAAYYEYVQFPFQPAYALTVHKAQGLTLDRVAVGGLRALGVPVPHGLAYVALSRVRRAADLHWSPPQDWKELFVCNK